MTKLNAPVGLAADYWRLGYVILPGRFRADEVEAWRGECERLLASELVDRDNIRTPFRFNSGQFPERIDPVVDVSPVFAALARDERITEAVREIFADEPLLFKDKLIFKLPGVGGYTMHQDQAWWQLCPPDDILSVSVAIDGAGPDNGGIALYSGYHGEMRTPAGVMRNFTPEEAAGIDPARRFLPETRPGDVVIFHSLTPHESGLNASDRPRRSLYLSYSAARSGDLHARYYEQYRERLSREGGEGASKRYFK